MKLPKRFYTTARYQGMAGDGSLTIAPSSATFVFSDRARRVYAFPERVEARPPVIVVRARLLPPGFNSSLVIHGDGISVTVLTWWGLGRRARNALATAAVETQEVRTWFSDGQYLTNSAAGRVRAS
jgi:hypothetical protein